MAQGRMLRKDVCESDSFAALNNSNAQLLLVLLTPWWDDHGKMIGEPIWIKGNVVRKLNIFTILTIKKCLLLISQQLNVTWWADEKENKWLYWEKFNTHQSISDEKKGKDRLPSPKNPKNPQKSSVIREVNIREDKIREGAQKEITHPPLVFITKKEEESFITDYGKGVFKEYVARLNDYGQQFPSRFNKYASHTATIRNWVRKDNIKKLPKPKPVPTPTIKQEDRFTGTKKKVNELVEKTANKNDANK